MIIFGTRGYLRVLAMVSFICNNCHNPAAQRVVQRITKFTLFFIPLFPIGKSYTTTCTFCGFSQKINKELADQYAAHGQQQQSSGPVGPAREQIPAGAPGGPTQFGGQPNGPSEAFGSPQQWNQPQRADEPQEWNQPQQANPPQQWNPAQPAQPSTPQDGRPYHDPSAP